MELTLICSLPNSAASARVRFTNPPLDAQYAGQFGNAPVPAIDEILMTLPPPLSRQCGTSVFTKKKQLRKFKVNCSSQISSVVSITGTVRNTPALLTRMSTLPHSRSTSLVSCSISGTFEISALKDFAVPPAEVISLTTSFAEFSLFR